MIEVWEVRNFDWRRLRTHKGIMSKLDWVLKIIQRVSFSSKSQIFFIIYMIWKYLNPAVSDIWDNFDLFLST